MAADSQTVVEMIFRGVDETTEATQAALKNIDKFNDSLQKVTGPLADTGKAVLKLEAAVLALGTAIVGFSVNQAMKFENATISLQKVLTDADPTMEAFTQHAREMGAEYGIASVSVLESMTSFKKAGFEAEEAFMLTRGALDMVIAGEVDMTAASSKLIAALKGFRAEASDATTVVDLLNNAANNYSVNFEQLLEGYAKFSPVASAANLSFEEALGILVPVVEVFQSGTVAATALNSSLLRLQSDNKRVTDSLTELGVSQLNANGELKSAGEIYFEVAAALQTVDDSQRTYYAQQLVGINQSAKFLAAVEGLNTTLHIASEEFDYVGSAAKEVEIVLASTQKEVDRAKVAFSGIFAAIGEPLLEDFGNLAAALREIFNAISTSVRDDDQLGGVVLFVKELMGDMAEALATAAANLPEAFSNVDFGAVIDSLRTLTDQVAELFRNWDLDTPEGLERIMQGLIIVFERLTNISAGIIQTFQWIFDAIGNASPEVLRLGESLDETIASILGFSMQVDAVLGGTEKLISMLQALVGVLTVKAGANLATSLGVTATGLGTLATKAGITAAGLGTTGLVAAAGGAGFALGTLVDKTFDLSGKLADGAWAIREWVTDAKGIEASAELAARQQLALARETAETTKALEEMARKDAEFDHLWDIVTQGGQAFDTIEEALNNAVDTQKVFFDEATGKWLVLGEAVKGFGGAFSDIDDSYDILQNKLDRLGQTVTENGKTWQYAQDAAGRFFLKLVEGGEATGAITDATKEAATTTKAYGDATGGTLSVVSSQFAETGSAAKAAFEQTDAYYLKLMELASDERIANIEARVTINVAEMETQARRVESAFESINNTISSTGEVLQTLYGVFAGADNLFDKIKIERWIDEENKRRDQALDLQRDLVKAEIDLLNARARSLNRGDAAISITADGLQPHLEAFMWEIIRQVQMRVNQDGLEMLLGA